MNYINDEIDELILETISFFEPMTKEMIILDFDSRDLYNLHHFDTAIFEDKLIFLVKLKKIKKYKKNKETYYLRKMPKKSLLSRLKAKLYK